MIESMGVHPTAVVADGAQLGDDVEIGPYSVVGPDVRLGARCRIHAHVVLQGDTHLGEDCEVFSFAVLGNQPQDRRLGRGEPGGPLRIGRRNRIREHVTIQGGTRSGLGITRVGDDNMLLVGCHIGHDATVGNRIVFTNGAMAAGHTQIGDGAILGAMVGIHQFARVGPLAMVGAGAMMSHDAPPFALVQGDRARLVGVNLVGLHRAGIGSDQAATIKRVYRLLFWRGGKFTDKIEAIRRSPLAREDVCREILDFVASSKRGICVPRSRRMGLDEDREISDSDPS